MYADEKYPGENDSLRMSLRKLKLVAKTRTLHSKGDNVAHVAHEIDPESEAIRYRSRALGQVVRPDGNDPRNGVCVE